MRRLCAIAALFLSILSLVMAAVAATPTPLDASSSPPDVVYLLEGNTWQFGLTTGPVTRTSFTSDLLMRQLFRQSLLIAARHELGLTTRDEAIGDSMPEDAAIRVHMGCRHRGRSRGIFVKHPGKKSPEQVRDYRYDQPDGRAPYVPILVSAEEMSRGWFVETLDKLGFSGKPLRRNPEAEVPSEAERLLTEMTFTSQFHAIRLLHEAIRRDGESDALLGALTRGYANLGWLCENQWLRGPSVFKARALLYAQRMVARDEHRAWALYHRAYALAAASLHADALADLEAASKIKSSDAKAPFDRPPAWADLIDAHSRFEWDKLDAEKVESSLGQLAELLRLVNLELTNGVVSMGGVSRYGITQNTEAAMRAVKAMPECYRAHDFLCNYSGVGVGHHATLAGIVTMGQKLYGRLAAMPDLPPQVQKLIAHQVAATSPLAKLSGSQPLSPPEECQLRGELIALLMDANDQTTNQADASEAAAEPIHRNDRGEPSWATLGYLIRETSFLQVFRRARFMKRSLGVSADSFLAHIAALVAHHPFRAYIETYASDPLAEREAAKQLWKADYRNLDLLGMPLYYSLAMLDQKKARVITWYFNKNSDETVRQTVIRLGYSYPLEKEGARRILAISPRCPFARAALLSYDWDAVVDQAGQWEKDAAGKSCSVLGVLANTYYKLGILEDAERCFKAAAETSPDAPFYFKLAEIYTSQGDEDKALAVLEECLTKPDYGLSHSSAKARIAEIYMDKGEWEKALPHAEEAAQAYSGHSLVCAAECYEGLCRWKEAEDYYRAASERYEAMAPTWYFFCRRTGQGDLAAAERLIEQYLRDPNVASAVEQAKNNIGTWSAPKLSCLGTYYMLNKKYKEATDCFEAYFERSNNPQIGLWAAIAADAAGDSRRRDDLLKRVIQRGNEMTPPNPQGNRNVWARLAGLMVDDLAAGGKGKIDRELFDRIADYISTMNAMDYHWLFAKYLQLRGQEKKAVYYWKRCLACRPLAGMSRTMAGAELVARDYSPDCYQTLPPRKNKMKATSRVKPRT
ncbi:MAG TPA: hypothetical protein VJL29_05255 [Thermoguttaceae bacterium]|nr:hypothetical protein [Thermoguttaceae bacterium]